MHRFNIFQLKYLNYLLYKSINTLLDGSDKYFFIIHIIKRFHANHYNLGNSQEHTVYLRYVLDPWQGEKSVKMRINNYSSASWNVRIHRTARWEGSTGTDAYIMPQFMMYSVL